MSEGNLFNQISNFSANKFSSYIRTLPEYLNVRFPLSLTYTQARAKVKRVKSKEKSSMDAKSGNISGGRERERNFSI